MNNIRLNQIWRGKIYNFSFNTITIKINKHEPNFIEGIVVSDDLAGLYSNVGQFVGYNTAYFLVNFKLIQDRVGKNCNICNKFYNEAEHNIYNDLAFICWSCDIL